MTAGATRAAVGGTSAGLLGLLTLVRYRFFLFAGIMPYLLGAAWAFARASAFDATRFWAGLAGVGLAVVGVETFNEYFDSKEGTDRVFNPVDIPPVSKRVFWIGCAAFAGAFAIGAALMVQAGWPILAFASLGGLAAVFYEAPPLRWSYRGLGEIVIGLAYGPSMVLGSLYLHTGRLTWPAGLAALVPGLSIVALAVVNGIPDFQQDRLVGKRNLVVRLGRRTAVWLYLGLAAASPLTVALGVAIGWFPPACLAALLGLAPLALSAPQAFGACERPRAFLPAIRAMLSSYMLVVSLFTVGLFFS